MRVMNVEHKTVDWVCLEVHGFYPVYRRFSATNWEEVISGPPIVSLEVLEETYQAYLKDIEEKKESIMKLTNYLAIRLKVCMKSGICYNFENRYSLEENMTCMKSYYPFYKWFYFRKSPAYTFMHTKGADVFIRSEIVYISFRYEKVV